MSLLAKIKFKKYKCPNNSIIDEILTKLGDLEKNDAHKRDISEISPHPIHITTPQNTQPAEQPQIKPITKKTIKRAGLYDFSISYEN